MLLFAGGLLPEEIEELARFSFLYFPFTIKLRSSRKYTNSHGLHYRFSFHHRSYNLPNAFKILYYVATRSSNQKKSYA